MSVTAASTTAIMVVSLTARAVKAASVSLAAFSISVISLLLIVVIGALVAEHWNGLYAASTMGEEGDVRSLLYRMPLYFVAALALVVAPVLSFVSLLTKDASRTIWLSLRWLVGASVVFGLAAAWLTWRETGPYQDLSMQLADIGSTFFCGLALILFQWLSVRGFLWASGVNGL